MIGAVDRQPSETLLSRAHYRALSHFRFEIRRFLHFSEQAARGAGLEPQQHQLLLAVAGFDGQDSPTIGDLADHLLLRHHSVVGLVDRLAARGLVERVRHLEDRRLVQVRLTPKGAQVLDRLSHIHRAELRRSGPGLIQALRGLTGCGVTDSPG